MSSSHIINIQALPLVLETHRATAYSDIAGYALLIEVEARRRQLYDHFLNLGEEIDHIWTTPWNVGKILYYAAKYPAFLDGAFSLYIQFAPFGTTPSTSMVIAGIIVAEFVLVFRTWAVWGKNSKVGISLLCVGLLMAALSGYFAHHSFSLTTFGPSPIGVDYVCWIVTPAGNIIFLDYILLVIFETIILILTILKCLQHLRISKSRLIVILYRDGVLYYMYLTVNLRKAARDNCKDSNALTTTGRTNFSSVVLGVNTWFHNPNAITQMVMKPSYYVQLLYVWLKQPQI
ncbi:hypothetical protein BU17DRAFT_70830 [Hysterangium stoloniferum]|nr:hypothetical protein BU17DRAFT_70830 [Hysterangium stoloniferum]